MDFLRLRWAIKMIINMGLSVEELRKISTHFLEDRISGLLHAHQRGYHLLILDRICGRWLLENLSFSKRESALIEQLILEITQTGNLRKNASIYIEICPPSLGGLITNTNKIFLPLDHKNFYEILEKPVFIVEDIDADLKLYEALISHFSQEINISSYRYEAYHGGGSGVERVSKSKILEGRIVYSILDSDKISPSCADSKYNHFHRLKK